MRDCIAALLEDADAALDVEGLLKIVLVLLVILLALEVVEELFKFAFSLLKPLLTLVVVGLIVLWLLDRL